MRLIHREELEKSHEDEPDLRERTFGHAEDFLFANIAAEDAGFEESLASQDVLPDKILLVREHHLPVKFLGSVNVELVLSVQVVEFLQKVHFDLGRLLEYAHTLLNAELVVDHLNGLLDLLRHFLVEILCRFWLPLADVFHSFAQLLHSSQILSLL